MRRLRAVRRSSPVIAIAIVIVFVIACVLCPAGAGAADATLKIYLLCGQSNMTGQAPGFQGGDDIWAKVGQPQITSLEYLVHHPEYRQGLDPKVFPSLSKIDAAWLKPRDDVWGVHFDSGSNKRYKIHHADGWDGEQKYTEEARTLRPGFGNTQRIGITEDGAKRHYYMAMIGPELAMGHRLGEALEAPVFLFKSDRGGTDLTKAWRPPSTVRREGGEVGANYAHTVEQFQAFLKQLDADLADDGQIQAYGNAAGYEVCGFVWMQGFNDRSTEEKIYQAALIDLVHDIRHDLSRPQLPAIIVESADTDAELNRARQAAVDALNIETPGRAVLVKTGDVHAITGGYHYSGRAEAYLEIGWRIGGAVLEHGFTGK